MAISVLGNRLVCGLRQGDILGVQFNSAETLLSGWCEVERANMEPNDTLVNWIEQVCNLPLRFRLPGSGSIRELFAPADAYLNDRSAFIAAITLWIQAHGNLVDAWIGYCEDRRGSPAPYFRRESGSLVVGFYDSRSGTSDEIHHTDEIEACVDYIYREASWVLRHRRVM